MGDAARHGVLEGDALEAVLPAALLERCSALAGRRRTVSELSGGLTNRNFRITTDDGDFVLRLSTKESLALSVDRNNEYANTVLAASSGVGAPVYDFLPDDSVLVIGFLEGVTYTDESFQRPGTIERVAAAVRRLHEGPRFVNDFDMFAIQAEYQATVIANGYRLPADYLDFEPIIRRIEAALGAAAVATVPCNNDLLAGNFIDDGDEIHLIDYEYSGNNDPYFELGNIWSECHLADEQLAELVDAYVGRPAPGLVARARLQALMSQYGWTLWASIQDATSAIDFDFWSWGMEKYDRAVALLRSPVLDELLDLAGRAD
jgi:thiamine kinase-like enzyme